MLKKYLKRLISLQNLDTNIQSQIDEKNLSTVMKFVFFLFLHIALTTIELTLTG